MQFLLSNTLLISWVIPIVSQILIFGDAIIYAIADSTYKLFHFAVNNFNLSAIGGVLSAAVGRVMTLVTIFMLFRIIMIFIQYAIEPEKLKDKKIGGTQIITHVIVTIIMLALVYSGVLFGLFKDVQLLILGNSTSELTVIPKDIFESSENENVIRNLIFGATGDSFDDFGRELAANLFGSFLYIDNGEEKEPLLWSDEQIKNQGKNGVLFHNIATGEKGFLSATTIDWSDSRLKYVPFISAIGGLYMIYTFFVYTMDILIRAFKLFFMEIISPIAIASYVDPNKGEETFKKFFKMYFQIYFELFIRVALVYLSVILIKSGIDAIIFRSTIVKDLGFLPRMILYVMAIIAVFRFLKIAPRLISDLTGIKMDDKKGSFGKMLGGVFGAGIGTVIGIGTAGMAGASFGAAAFQGLTGGIQGGMSGASSKSFGDFATKQLSTSGKISGRSYQIKDMGGLGNYASGAIGSTLGSDKQDNREIANIDKQISKLDQNAGIYSHGNQLRENLNSEIDREFNKRYGSFDDYVKNDTSGSNRGDLLRNYESAHNIFSNDVLSGSESVDSINHAKEKYNEYAKRNENLDGYKNGEIKDLQSLEKSKESARQATNKIDRDKYDLQQQKKDIQGTQKYKNIQSYKGSNNKK